MTAHLSINSNAELTSEKITPTFATIKIFPKHTWPTASVSWTNWLWLSDHPSHPHVPRSATVDPSTRLLPILIRQVRFTKVNQIFGAEDSPDCDVRLPPMSNSRFREVATQWISQMTMPRRFCTAEKRDSIYGSWNLRNKNGLFLDYHKSLIIHKYTNKFWN